jgi:urea transport system permease protein
MKSLLGLVRWLVALCCLVLTAPAWAADMKAALTEIGSGDLTRVQAGIAQLGASDDPRALAVLQAIEEKQLFIDASGRAFLKDGDKTVDAVTGAPAESSGTLTTPTINNVLRRSLGPAIAQLRLRSKDYETRFEAATELSKRPSEELVPPMREAFERETNDDIRALLGLGIAMVDLEGDDHKKKLAALSILREEGDISHKGPLEGIVAKTTAAAAGTPDAALNSAAAGAIVAIDRRAFFINMLANLFYGVSLGSVLLLAALGLAITFGLMKVINMAHGEMLMIGAYSTFVVQNLFGESLQDYYLLAAIPVAFIVTASVGLLLERTVIRFLYGRPLETLLATWGISLVLIQIVRLVFGAQNVAVANPSWLSGGFELMPTVVLPYSRIATILFVLIVVSFVWFLMRKTRLGLYVRAVTQNREMAGNIGIPTQKIDMWTFAFGSGVAGLGGVALSQLGNVGPELGQGYIVDSFMVVVLGGVGNIIGTIAGALGLGLINKFLEPLAGAVLGKIVILVFVILFIQKRPQGLFALKGRAAEL